MVVRRRIPLLLEGFGIEAVEYQSEALGVTPGEFLARAAHYHLGIAGARRETSFLGEPPAEWPRALTVALEPSSWEALEHEAFSEGITVAQLLARVSLRLAADLDSGRAAARIWAAADWAEVA
jgi:hypothetical protein